MSSLGFPPGMGNRVSPGLTLGPDRQAALSAAPAGSSCIICYQATAWDLCAPSWNWAWYLPSVSIFSALSSAVSCCANCVAEVKKKPNSSCPQTTDVVVSGACGSAPSLAEHWALAHLLYISENFPSFQLWMDCIRIFFSFFLFSRWVENCHFARMAWFSVSTQAVAQWQVRYGWGGFWGHRATLLHKSSAEMLRMRDWNLR